MEAMSLLIFLIFRQSILRTHSKILKKAHMKVKKGEKCEEMTVASKIPDTVPSSPNRLSIQPLEQFRVPRTPSAISPATSAPLSRLLPYA